MGQNNKPADDAKSMKDEYVSGVSINDIALKYNHTTEEVTEVVTTPVTDEEPVEVKETTKGK